MVKILSLYYSRDGATTEMANLIARGVESIQGAEAVRGVLDAHGHERHRHALPKHQRNQEHHREAFLNRTRQHVADRLPHQHDIVRQPRDKTARSLIVKQADIRMHEMREQIALHMRYLRLIHTRQFYHAPQIFWRTCRNIIRLTCCLLQNGPNHRRQIANTVLPRY